MPLVNILDEGSFTYQNRTNINNMMTELYAAAGPANTALCTTQTDVTSSTALVNITGMSEPLVPGTYIFKANLVGTANAAGGWKVAFKLNNSLAISSIQTTAYTFTASAVAVSLNTTTTDQTSILAVTAANIAAQIEGVVVVTTAGTFQLQFAQNASNGAASSIFVNSFMDFEKIA